MKMTQTQLRAVERELKGAMKQVENLPPIERHIAQIQIEQLWLDANRRFIEDQAA